MEYNKLTTEELYEEYERCIESGKLHLSMGNMNEAVKYSTLSQLAFEELSDRTEKEGFVLIEVDEIVN